MMNPMNGTPQMGQSMGGMACPCCGQPMGAGPMPNNMAGAPNMPLPGFPPSLAPPVPQEEPDPMLMQMLMGGMMGPTPGM